MPKLSVILPAYNAAKTINRSINSILGQSFSDFDLIVVDDGSSDATLEELSRYSDSRLKVFSNDHHGVAKTANFALQQSTSDLVVRMDADDFAHPTKFQKQIDYLQKFDLDVVGCQIKICNESAHCPLSMKRYEDWINHETLLASQISMLRFVEFPLVNPTILAKRSYFKIGFEDNDLPEDYELFLKAISNGMKFGKVPEYLFDWFDHGDRLTRTHQSYSPEAFDLCRKKHLRLGPLNKVSEVDLWGAGKTGKHWMRWLLAEGIDVRHVYEVNQRKIGKTIHGTKVLSFDTIKFDLQTPLVVAVGAVGAREQILEFLRLKKAELQSHVWFVA